jgi:hypothetical protein
LPDVAGRAGSRRGRPHPIRGRRRVCRGYQNQPWVRQQPALDRHVGRRSYGFVKHAAGAATAAWLRREFEVYQHVRGNFHPDVLGWFDDGELPVLVLEDRS